MGAIMSLGEAARYIGVRRGRARPDRTARAIITRLEAQTGLMILVAIGDGRARRYSVIRRALEKATGGEMKKKARVAP